MGRERKDILKATEWIAIIVVIVNVIHIATYRYVNEKKSIALYIKYKPMRR